MLLVTFFNNIFKI